MIQLYDVRLPIGQEELSLLSKIASLLDIRAEDIQSFRIVRKSLDARRERPPEYNYVVEFALPNETEVFLKLGDSLKLRIVEPEETSPRSVYKATAKKKTAIVGCGPAGLFAALKLSKKGFPPILLERGKQVEKRIYDIRKFWSDGILNPESNVHYGEGGAGTFSDGKLTTRIKNRNIDSIRRVLVDFGAPPEILIEAKPHIGTDKLRLVLINLRNRLIELGCEIKFESRMTDLLIRNGTIEGLVANDREEIKTDNLILATGQSCADTYEILAKRGVALAQKAFAMGVRVEHPQELINHIQYGKWWQHKDLPPAEYALTAKSEDPVRSVYTFCMCPGGQVIGCSSEAETVVTNGMSHYRRNGAFANSAIVVNVRPDDFNGESPLAGLQFRRLWEERAYLEAGKDYFAPAQKITDFLKDRESAGFERTTFLPGIKPAPLKHVLPEFIAAALRRGLLEFERKMPGFLTSEAVLIGVETRTSSPVRVLRNENAMSNIRGLYPCGEGSGYAGGIMSSAVDGDKAAEMILSTYV